MLEKASQKFDSAKDDFEKAGMTVVLATSIIPLSKLSLLY